MKTMPPTRLRERAAAIVFALGVGLGVSPCWLVGLEGVAVAAGADAATAQVLFEDGKRLAAASKFVEACPKFAESQRLDPAAGTLLHLGNCYEKTGRTASAWATFLEAASAAKQQSRGDWAELATARAEALRPKLAHLAIFIADRPPGLVVKRDGTVLTAASLGAPFPVDPGAHAVELSAPGRKSRSISRVVGDGEQAALHAPSLELDSPTSPVAASAPGAAPVAASPVPPEAPSGGNATLGYVVGGLGVAGLGVGALTGALAIGKNNESKELCPSAGRCASQAGIAANDSAKTLGTVSTIAFVAGGVAVAAGAVLVLTSGPRARAAGTASVSVGPAVGPEGAGLLVGGAF
ncbi:MAG: hypothetical protein IPF92_17080 [Myxococcales bacterium]|nr:hypothetical protein [Myxococcales bacterium]MBL0195516.1 hypothetical protein [Myxococcales bacterium]HQY64385.1 hypothetical protein [Polyangiaceae bacterium]